MANKTNYANLSDHEFYALLRNEQWKVYPPELRLVLFQEVENRQAAKQGREALTIETFKPKKGEGSLMGYFSQTKPDVLHINEKFLSGKSGLLRDYSVAAGLGIIIHEGRHAYQHAVVEGEIPDADEQLRKNWTLNMASYIDGTGGLNGQVLYTQQEIERDAREYAEKELTLISEAIREETGFVDAKFEKSIYKLRAQEAGYSVCAKVLIRKEQLDAIEELARFNGSLLHPDLDLEDASMFAQCREMLEKMDMMLKSDHIDSVVRADQGVEADDIESMLKKLREKAEAEGMKKESPDAAAFREGFAKKGF